MVGLRANKLPETAVAIMTPRLITDWCRPRIPPRISLATVLVTRDCRAGREQAAADGEADHAQGAEQGFGGDGENEHGEGARSHAEDDDHWVAVSLQGGGQQDDLGEELADADDHQQQADTEADGGEIVAGEEHFFGEEGEGPDQQAEAEASDEADRQDCQKRGVGRKFGEAHFTAGAVTVSRLIVGGEGFFECEPGQQDGREGRGGREEEGDMGTELAGEDATDGGTDDEAQAEGRHDVAEGVCALVFRHDIGDVSLGDDDIAAGDAVEDAREKEQGYGLGEADHDEGDDGADLADQEDGQAAATIGEPADEGTGDELRGKEGGQKQGDGFGCHVKLGLGVERQDGIDHGCADHLNKDDQEDGEHAAVNNGGFSFQGDARSV